MAGEPLFSLRNRWFTVSAGVTAAVAVIAAGFGFIWLPFMERNTTFAGIWQAICSAAGAPQPPRPAGLIVEPAFTLSNVIINPGAAPAGAEAIGRGATLALRCTMCHGARGLSEANSPNLAGQYPQAVFKQLEDFRSGARANAVMSPLVANLTAQDAHDLAAYYAYLPRPPWPDSDLPTPAIVERGAPMRGIAPCGACHGSVAHKAGSPWLEGEPTAYLRAQLMAFKTGARHNDTGAQMRNVARLMTDTEIEAAARFYGEP